MISVHGVRKAFGDLVAVDDVSFDIPAGQIFGLLGPNGAGKTTTINMLVGILKPDRGEISIDGGGSPANPAVRARIGNAPQSLAIYEELTAEENLMFFGRLYGLSGAKLRERVAACLELVGLTERKHSRAATFSGGMKRRLNMACALVHRPPILILDEPTVGVDPQSRNLVFDKIEALKDEGITLVYTTHYMEEAQRLCDRVAIVDHGRILDLDSVDGLIASHGGKAVVQIEFDQPPSPKTSLPGTVEGTRLRFETERPIEDVAGLMSQGLQFRKLHVDRPDLESVFLNLTGRRLRD